MQQRNFQKIIISLIFIFIITLSEKSNSALFFETASKVEKKDTLTTIPTTQPTSPQINPPSIASEKPVEIAAEKNIKDSLKKFELILSREKKIENIISLQFNRIVCLMQLARISRVKNGGKVLVNEEEEFLKSALSIIEDILKINNLPNQVKSQMLYFKGLSYLDLGLKEKSRENLEMAILAYPDSKFVTSLSLYLADLLYDERKLPEALVAYKKYYSKMNPQEKDLADYKVSWIYLNQSKLDQAVDLFLSLVNNSTSQSVVQDSIISLSLALSEKLDQGAILDKLENAQVSEVHRVEILSAVYENFLKQPEKERSRIFDRILSSKANGETIVKLICIELQMMKIDDKINKEIYSLQKIQRFFYQNTSNFKDYSRQTITILGEELERIIANSLKLYQKEKVENSYQALSTSIDIYLKLNLFNRHVEVTSLLMDLLVEKNKIDQLMILCREILTNPNLVALKNKAKLQILLNYEKNYLSDTKKFEAKFFNLVKVYLKDLKADQWESVALKFSEYLVKANLNSEAEEVLANLNANKPSLEYFLRLISIKFELKKCSEIISLLSNRVDLDSKLLDYKRECHLILAQDSKAHNKSSEAYQKSILEFIALSTGSKKNAAIADYLKTMGLEKDTKEKEKYYELLENRFFNDRFEKEIFPVYQKEILSLIELGMFSKALSYLKNCEKNESCKDMTSLESIIKEIQSFDSKSQINISKSHNYEGEIAKYLSLVHPEIILQYVEKESNKKYPNPRILLLASRLHMVDWSDPNSKNIYNQVFDLLNKDEKHVLFSLTLQKINKIKFPNEKNRNRLKDQEILFLMKKVQQTRKSILTDLGQYSINSQKVLLNKAMEAEMRMADVIKLSPIPANLDASKVKEYEEGLRQLAEEFDLQAKSYLKSLANLDQQKTESQALYLHLIVDDEIEKWIWGNKDDYADKVKGFVKAEQYMQALFYLDYLLSSSKISKEDYFARRAGVLLFSAKKRNKIVPMIKYVLEECETNNQLQILNSWKERSLK